jgi:putative membrane protein
VIERNKWLLIGLLLWYLGLSVWAAYAPTDRQFWLLASVLPGLFVLLLVATHRLVPLSHASYLLITLYLTLHTVGTHYTYAQMPAGAWFEGVMHLGRNHYDRLVHFCFGFLLAFPVEELFRLATRVRGWLLYYLPVITILGLSGLWEIIESWVARAVHPEEGIAYLGSQGDVWDAQKDMEAALYGAVLCVMVLLVMRAWRRWSSASQPSELVGT